MLRGHETLPINGLSFDLLMVLVEDAPNLVTPDELMKRVWPGVVVNPETISQRVKLLRHALGDDARSPKYIGAVRGRGYRAIASVTSGSRPEPRRINLRVLSMGLALVGIFIALVALYIVQSSGLFLRKHSPAALDLYARARHLHQSLRIERMDKAIRYYERAIELDPRLARAYVGLADALMLRRQVVSLAPTDPTRERVASLARTALEIDPRSGDAHAILGRELASSFDLKGAAREFALGESATPTGEYVLRYLAQFHGCCAMPVERAIEYAQRGEALDRLNPWAETNVAIAYWEAHRFEEALRQIDLVLEVDPDFWVAHQLRNVVLDNLGRFDQALAGARRAVTLNDCNTTRTDLAIAYARVGDTERARQIYDELSREEPGVYWPPTEMAMVLVALDDRTGALAALERAYSERDGMLVSALHSKRLAPLEGEPRFRRLVQLLGQEGRVGRVVPQLR